MSSSPARVGAPLYSDQWSNRKAALVAFRIGQGVPYPAIARELNDGTTTASLRRMAREWQIRPDKMRPGYAPVPVPLFGEHRTAILQEAKRRGRSLPELIGEVTAIIVRDDMFGAVIDCD